MQLPEDLDPQDIAKHRARIAQVIARKAPVTFPILDTCRVDNGGIIRLPDAKPATAVTPRVVAFVPAAGAASRYYAPLAPLCAALEAKDSSRVVSAVEALRAAGGERWPLPACVEDLVAKVTRAQGITAADMEKACHALALPKALQPSRKAGPSFLCLKFQEHRAQAEVMADVFVVPPGSQREFAAEADREAPGPGGKPHLFLEQGGDMSTIRFRADGTPWRDEEQNVSRVPAGHGTLVKLFPKVKAAYPAAEALFIRNIDNVTGTSPEAVHETSRFLGFHAQVLQRFQRIRAALADERWPDAESEAKALWDSLPEHPALAPEQEAYMAAEGAAFPHLWRVQFGVIHMQPAQFAFFGEASPQALLRRLYARPVNVLGQVPNSGKDVGGTPVFIASPFGRLKLSLELPHATEADVKAFLARPDVATHFNPVFVAAELITDWRCYDPEDNPFWIIAEKTFRNEKVYYHETVLYELLGNNLLANCLFVEVSRRLFHPHKALTDGIAPAVTSPA